MMKNNLYFLLLFCILVTSCTKQPGIGGEASITGRIYANHYNSTFTVLLNSYYVPDTYVYLIFGDDINYGARINTNYNGEFEFKYLYPGDYTVYTYSIDSAAIVNFAADPPDSAMIRQVTITDKNEIIDVGDILIYE